MQTNRILVSMLGALVLAIIYHWIEMTIGLELDVLLWASVITVVAGLYSGLQAENKEIEKEET